MSFPVIRAEVVGRVEAATLEGPVAYTLHLRIVPDFGANVLQSEPLMLAVQCDPGLWADSPPGTVWDFTPEP